MKDIINSVLTDFNILFDTDIGAALYVYMKSSNKEYFEDYLKEASYEFFRFKVLTRKDPNPIKFLFKKEYKKSADDIYKDLFNQKWDKVIANSPMTDILPAFVISASNYGIITQVNCKNQAEVDKMHSISSWETFINIKDVTPYSTINIHDIMEVLNFDVVGKTVYVYDYALNYLNNDMVTKAIHPIAIPFAGTTQFKIISPFKDFQLPEGFKKGE